MKILIASDIHGSAAATEKLLERFAEEKADTLVLLGDIYNHGPRNGIPDGYDPMLTAEYLNAVTKNLIVIKGNCDSEVDEMISDFDFAENAYLFIDGKKIYLTHGHVRNENNLPKNADAVFYGHFHIGFIKKIGDITVANPGSVTFPKNGSEKSYLLLQDGLLVLKTLDGRIITESRL
jgi:putative phosphoesterase